MTSCVSSLLLMYFHNSNDVLITPIMFSRTRIGLLHMYPYYMCILTTCVSLLHEYPYYMNILTTCVSLLHEYPYYMCILTACVSLLLDTTP